MIKTPSKRMVKNKAKTTARKKGKKSTKIKLEAKPLTEEQILEFVRHYNEHGSFPGSKIPCNMTGKLTTCVGPWMIKKIKEYGGPENLLRKYKCRGALKAKREALKPVSKNKKRRQVLKEMKTEQKDWNIPKMSFTPPQPLSDAEITECTKGACLRPDIFLDNDRHCDGCEFFDLCSCASKALLGAKFAKRKLKK
jgi:hypothetical protein